jgi:Rps23 Pro-64 3,4-dihydroxylase Tpa1-like proline 4-hydroxylase
MAHPQPVQTHDSIFPHWKWNQELNNLSKQYQGNRPFPHVLLKDFLNPQMAYAIATEFPPPTTDAWVQYKHHNENKLGLNKRSLFPRNLGEVVDELNSAEFVAWLSVLTGIPNLVPDPSLEGGGLHQSGPGGFLNVHTDFTMHHYHKHWRRRVNLILYLNEGWREEWGGSIELWDRQMKSCGAKFPPIFNHALIFNTDEGSFHGFPEPLLCPANVSRKSLALYYYTVEQNGKTAARSTNYRGRPGDSFGKSAMIWLDKEAVDLYSRAKSIFGFSDEFASKVLGFLSKKSK